MFTNKIKFSLSDINEGDETGARRQAVFFKYPEVLLSNQNKSEERNSRI